jgi:asparagine synthase (glutamine-hydrolysing)
MCGIVGIVHWGRIPDAMARTRRMAASIRHRGPDDEGYWSDGDVALGAVRLSIVDLAGGHQPMANEDQTVWVVFNGEVYNHVELRRELVVARHAFASSHSDTEVLVHGWEEWGERLPAKLNGMFALALWDARTRSMFLARDRYGVKPLYVTALEGGGVVFASEIRALHASGLVSRTPRPSSIVEYFTQQNLWGQDTFFAGVSLFPPATAERVGASGSRRWRYWDYRFSRGSRLSLADAAVAHRELLQVAVRRQMGSDVPVVCYLSGGMDSSSICAVASQVDAKMRAYSCIFDLDGVGEDRCVDEREFARAAVRWLGIEGIEYEVSSAALPAALRPTIRALEEPRMGMSYQNFLIARRVAHDGKVVLSGTGGDELHGGYVYRYQATAPWRRRRARGPGWAKDLLRRTRTGAGRRGVSPFLALVNVPIPEARIGDAFTPEFLAAGGPLQSVEERVTSLLAECPSDDPWDQMMYLDARAYLHGLLVLEDKLSMAHSLEARVPLLDNDLVDFVCDLPWRHLCDGVTGKIVFRESVRPLVPAEVYRKPKMGFGPPDASWYRGPLRPFLEETLATARIARRGVLQPAFVARVLAEHFAGRVNHVALIWSLLSLEAWCEEFAVLGGDG